MKAKDVSLVIGSAILTAVLMNWLFDHDPENTPGPPVKDDQEIARLEREREGVISERDSWKFKFQKLLGTRTPGTPQITYGTFERPITFEQVEDTGKKVSYLAPAYDFPLYGNIEPDLITLSTVNPFLEISGLDSRKVYKWERLSSNFYFALQPTKSITSNAITLTFQRSFFSFDGFYWGGAVDLNSSYLWTGARFSFLETLQFEVSINTRPMVEVRAGVKF